MERNQADVIELGQGLVEELEVHKIRLGKDGEVHELEMTDEVMLAVEDLFDYITGIMEREGNDEEQSYSEYTEEIYENVEDFLTTIFNDDGEFYEELRYRVPIMSKVMLVVAELSTNVLARHQNNMLENAGKVMETTTARLDKSKQVEKQVADHPAEKRRRRKPRGKRK